MKQASCVDDTKESDLLLPDFKHGVVEGEDVFLTLALRVGVVRGDGHDGLNGDNGDNGLLWYSSIVNDYKDHSF